MAEPHDIDERTVSSEARRVLPLLKDMEPDNRRLLSELAEGATIQELAEDFTSGNLHTLKARFENVLYRRLGFTSEHSLDEVRAALKLAFVREDQPV